MASELGRGAQVRLDGEVRQFARGGTSLRLIDNIREKLELEAGGTVAAGNNADGSAGDGTAAEDEVLVPGGDAFLITPTFTASGTGAIARTVQNKQREHVSVLDFIPLTYHADIATRISTVDVTAYIQAGIDAVNAAGGGILYCPPGRYYRPATSATLAPKSNVTLLGYGMGRTVFKFDDTSGSNKWMDGTTAVTDFTIEGLTIEGMRETISSAGVVPLAVQNSSGIRLLAVEVRQSRAYGIYINACSDVAVEGCRIYRTNWDGIVVTDTPDARITSNTIEGANDDGISVHVGTTSPARSGIVVANNTLTESQGIKVLGAKSLSITGNVMRRMMAFGIFVGTDSLFPAVDTAVVAINITGNTITDVFRRSETSPRNGLQVYIWVDGGSRNAGGGAAVPGTPDTATGAIVSPFGTTTGNYYSTGTGSTVPSPGGSGVVVANNILKRTLPAVSAYTDWGYGSLFTGDNNGGVQFDGAIPESALNTPGIRLAAGALRDTRIEGNVIATTGASGIAFAATNSDHLAYIDIAIEGNSISDFTEAGVFWNTGALTHARVRVANNLFDGDRRFVSANRGVNGKWLSSNVYVAGIYIPFASGFTVEGNAFRNLRTPVHEGSGVNVFRRNTIHANPVATGFSANNQGVGNCPPAGEQYGYVIEDCDPTSATFGQILNTCPGDAASIPTAGTYVKGQFVRNNAPTVAASKVLLGWARLTTGSAHVSGTDWSPVYGTVS